MKGTTVQNAENSGNVTASWYTNGIYTYHSAHYKTEVADPDVNYTENVYVANVGGIAGKADDTVDKVSEIENVTNTGNVSSNKQGNNDYYDAGNVGGIVGSAVDTNITNATNRENEVRGAHNVGGVAGYFGNSDDTDSKSDYTVTAGINDGGDIMATGARNDNGFVQEWVRAGDTGGEQTIVGNMGGVVGYMDGDNVYVTGSANRGTVHSLEITGTIISDASKASNTGGIVGKIDRSDTETLANLQKEDSQIKAAVSDSYNTGDVRGYMGVGGVAGMMYNGEIARSYNLGAINTTRQVGTDADSYYSVNMGGIVGDTTEGTKASAVLYDVYNKGQIGDETYTYYARHIGGIVGRLSGTVDKAYNTGEIYNGYNVVGGIAGWFYKGQISNSFNTGNITVVNNEYPNSDGNMAGSQVGGIAGAVSAANANIIENAYNLGTIRSYYKNGDNAIGGIVGKIISGNKTVTIKNVYTTGNLYAEDNNGNKTTNKLGSIYGVNEDDSITIENAVYISPEDNTKFNDLSQSQANQHTDTISYDKKDDVDEWNKAGFSFSNDNGLKSGDVSDEDALWRIYNGTTPILNAFLPNAEDYFSGETGAQNPMDGINTIQYGTAYDPLLTIINANKDLTFDWGALGIKNDGGLAVYNAGLTLTDFKANGGTGYFGGIIYADESLKLDGSGNDIGLGATSQIYGSDVTIDTTGNITIYGDVTATGNSGKSDINISSKNGDVNVYGALTSATEGETIDILGIGGSSLKDVNLGNISDEYDEVTNMGERYSHTTTAQGTGNITISAGTYDKEKEEVVSEGNVNLYFGNQEEGLITTGGNLTVEATGDVYVDSDLDIGGDLRLTSTGKDGEVLLTLTNIGKVQADKFTGVIENYLNGKDIANIDAAGLKQAIDAAYPGVEFTEAYAQRIVNALQNHAGNKVSAVEALNNDIAVAYMHDFMHNFDHTAETHNKIYLNAESGDAKLTVDMWDYENNQYDFTKYDTKFDDQGTSHIFVSELNNLDLHINDDTAGVHADASKVVFVEVSTGEQLKAIQQVGDAALGYNYALMGDINASDVQGYEAIGGTTGFTGTFDGRGNRVIGLKVNNNNANAGIFSTVGNGGVVKNVNIYSGNFTGSANAGAVAGVNNGRIENIVTFGNTVTANSNAGGIVGVNNSGTFTKVEDGTTNGGELSYGIYDVESTGSVIAGSDSAIAGGLVGTNEGGLANSFSDSAVSVKVDNQKPITTTGGLGGVVGVNKGDVQMVDSLGVTNGGTTGSSNVGGIIGINNGNMYSGYNESIVSGSSNVGGIIGDNSSTVANVVNATSVTGKDKDKDNVSEYVGGLVGTNTGSVTNGRNNGTITGTNYVGGMVGNNADGSTLTNLVNDSSAAITGVQYVGGIAGKNDGIITANNSNLINRGSITGNQYVGGVAGMNTGEISNTVNSVVLNATGTDAKYFGGVAGYNNGVIGTVTNTSVIDVTAQYGTLVGGIIGFNDANGTLAGEIVNEGNISGKSEVGGIIGENINQSILNNEGKPRLTISNKGNVRATNGGAAGIFYDNQGVINNVDLINEGTVTGGTAKDSVTGGLFGKNSGKVTNSILTNSGIVTGGGTVGGLIGDNSGSASGSVFTNDGIVEGEDKVGGLFGINSGSFNTSSLINTVNAQVTGKQEVGGLIGKNTGKIEGGRDAADSYYKYQIYNNGTINVTGEGTHIGGLFGTNSGDVEAAYNTGVINAGQSSNVGGIAGVNEQGGKLDQVFNTVMTENGTDAITGDTNVGGLVGTNSGTLSNAYNTTKVNGNINVGNAVGVNDGTDAEVNFVYDVTNTNNTLIGENTNNATISNSYTSADAEKGAVGTDGITYVSADKANDKKSYGNFADGTWKFYDGNSNPLLKVFLTNLTINEVNKDGDTLKEFLNLVYNGNDQDLNIKDLINNGFIDVPDEEALKAYYNTIIDKESGESHLLQNADGQVDAKGYSDWLYSNQITANTDGKPFNPNNLGYDITYTTEGGTIDIGKLSINITLDDIYRIYGNVGNIFSDSTTENKTTYEDSYHVNTDGLDESLVNYIKDNLKVTFNEDEAIVGDKTQNVGSYDWSMNVTIGGNNASNYQINDTGLQATTVIGERKSHVEKADLTITLDDVERIYGNIDFVNNTNYGITYDGLTNGDENNTLNLSNSVNIDDGALIEVNGETRTNDVKNSPYQWTVTNDASNFTGVDDLGTNYNITVVAGNSKVTPKTITINDLLATIVYGNQYNKGLQINTGASLADGSIVYGDDVTLVTDNANYITGGKYDDNRVNRVTADVDTYTDSLYVTGLSLNGKKANNYVLDTTAAVGDITVTKADLTINVGNVTTEYGNAFTNSDYSHTLSGITNGDKADDINASLGGNYVNGVSVETGKATANAGTYEDKLDFANYNKLNNYNIKVEQGDVVVTKADLNIEADNITSAVGNVPKYTGTDIQQGLVNGDTISDTIYNYGVSAGTDVNVEGNYTVGIYVDGSYYELSNPDWSTVTGLDFLKNYNVTFTTGTLTVTEQVMPDLPDNWPNNRWDYLFADNPFDRNENFRERKAEVNFVDGAMEI